MPTGIYPRCVKRHAVIQPLDQSYRLIPLTQGQNAKVDLKDFALIANYNWHARWNPKTKSFYAVRVEGQISIKMHRELLSCPSGKLVDHRNGDTLDNRRTNLRVCDYFQNARNTRKLKAGSSRYKGVRWYGPRKKWQAYIKVDGVQVHLGYFLDEFLAAQAYDAAARLRFKEFARTNF